MNARLQILFDSRDIEEIIAADVEIPGMWAKATRTYRSAARPSLEPNPDARFTLLYQAALQGATAVLRAAGYRVRGDHNHQLSVATVAALERERSRRLCVTDRVGTRLFTTGRRPQAESRWRSCSVRR